MRFRTASDKRPYKRERNGKQCCMSSRTTESYLKRGESHATGGIRRTRVVRGRRLTRMAGKRREAR